MEMVILIAIAIIFGPATILAARLLVEFFRDQQSPKNKSARHLLPHTAQWLREHPHCDRATHLLEKLHSELFRNQHPEHIEAVEEALRTELARHGQKWYFVPLNAKMD